MESPKEKAEKLMDDLVDARDASIWELELRKINLKESEANLLPLIDVSIANIQDYTAKEIAKLDLQMSGKAYLESVNNDLPVSEHEPLSAAA